MARENNYVEGKFTRTCDAVDYLVIDMTINDDGSVNTFPRKMTAYGVTSMTFASYISKKYEPMTVAKIVRQYRVKITIKEEDLYDVIFNGKMPAKVEEITDTEDEESSTTSAENDGQTDAKKASVKKK